MGPYTKVQLTVKGFQRFQEVNNNINGNDSLAVSHTAWNPACASPCASAQPSFLGNKSCCQSPRPILSINLKVN